MNRFEVARPAVLSILIVLSVSVHGGKLYRWTDNDGRVHYGDRPPVERLDTEMEVSGTLKPLNVGDNSGETERVKEVFPQPTEAEIEYRRQRAERQRQQRERRQLLCEKARSDLAIISGPVVFLEDGKPVPVSEDERRQRALKLEKSIRKHCRE